MSSRAPSRATRILVLTGLSALCACGSYRKTVERGKLSEAVRWINALQRAEEMSLAKNGRYEPSLDAFKGELPPLAYFTPGKLKAVYNRARHFAGWSVTLVRGGPGKRPCSADYGCYEITYSIPGGGLVCDRAECARDLVGHLVRRVP
jgi:hypothetical protein